MNEIKKNESEVATQLLAIVGLIVLLPVILVGSAFVWGLTLKLCWNWIIPRIFIGAPVLTLWQAAALIAVIGIFKASCSKFPSGLGWKEYMAFFLWAPLFTIGWCWIIQYWI